MQEIIGGIAMILLGLLFWTQPNLLWKWKMGDMKKPDNRYFAIMFFVGFIFVAAGVLLLLGMIR